MKNKTVKEKIMTLVYKYEAYKLSMSDLIDQIDKLYRKEILEAYKNGYIDSHVADLETYKNL